MAEIIGFRNKDSDGAEAVESIIRPIQQEFYSKGSDEDFPLIISSSPKSWVGINPKDFTDEFVLSEEELLAYVDGFMEVIKRRGESVATALNTDSTIEASFEDSALEDDDIKLSMYRSFRSLYDKWITSSSTNSEINLFYNKLSDLDNKLLYNHFEFIDRSYSNIGNDVVIDITHISKLIENPAMTLYQTTTELLSKNDFDFFALPGSINFNVGGSFEDDELKAMFTATDTLNEVETTPKYVCMFIGGSSKAVDLKNGSSGCKTNKDYGDDGLKFDSLLIDSPEYSNNDTKRGVVAFKVAYGQENQSHFKSLQLDQTEFRETQESLMILDQLAKPKEGGGLTRASKGNSLYDVHLTRSYKCSVETLGNMMIQPLTYFILENVPMFNGVYLITDVKHSIKAQSMSTTFKGTRQPKVTVPLVTDALSLINISGTELSDSDKSGKDITEIGSGGNKKEQGTANNTSGDKNKDKQTVPGDVNYTTDPNIDGIIIEE